MVRILQIVNKMDRAGLETMLMNYYRHIDKKQIQFDFLTHRPDVGDYDEEIQLMGGKIYHAPRLYPQNYIKYFAYMDSFFSQHPEYRIVHSHIDAMSAFPLAAAKKAHVPVRIAHSHSTSIDPDFKFPIKWLAKQKLPSLATDFFSCSTEAARFLFGESVYQSQHFTVLKNAISVSDFSYQETIRKQKRAELHLQSQFTVGHVGRFAYQKNHEFLIDIFYELCKIHPNSVLLLIGDGECKEKIKKKVDHLSLASKVKFLGVRSDIAELLQAMDVFVFPSHYEGLPLAVIESQAAGLPTFVSEGIPPMAQVTNLLIYMNLSDSPEKWAKNILDSRSIKRSDHKTELKAAGFDVACEAEKLQKYYLRKWREIEN